MSASPLRPALVHPAGCPYVEIVDQTRLPHATVVLRLASADELAEAIARMLLRGAPLIGAAAAYGVAMAMERDAGDAALAAVCEKLLATRPTAVNLRWALERMRSVLAPLPRGRRAEAAWAEADAIRDEDEAINRAIGENGVSLIESIAARKAGSPVNVMTHCNAGALATIEWGTATAPIYLAHRRGIALHVWVSETRPRLQGANLTAWEMRSRAIAHAIVPDAACAHLMQRGKVDIVLVGADRVARSGDVCNKIGTFCKAIAAREHGIPFYAAVPGPTIDWRVADGIAGIPIEERAADEVLTVTGCTAGGESTAVRIAPEGSEAVNFAFDVTPARLVTGLITERGVCAASEQGLASLYPESRAPLAADRKEH